MPSYEYPSGRSQFLTPDRAMFLSSRAVARPAHTFTRYDVSPYSFCFVAAYRQILHEQGLEIAHHVKTESLPLLATISTIWRTTFIR